MNNMQNDDSSQKEEKIPSRPEPASAKPESAVKPESSAEAASPSPETASTSAEELSLWDSLKLLFLASRAFWLVNMVNFGDGIAYFGILTLLTRFLGSEVGMSDAMTGIAVSTFTGLVTLFMFGGGYISDWLGVRRAIFASLLSIGVGRLLLAFCPGIPGFSLIAAWMALVFMALGSGVLQPALYAGVKEFTDPRTASIGFGILYSIMNLGIVAENFISPYLRTDEVFSLGFTQIHGLNLGIDGVYLVCAGITVLMFLAHVTFFTKKVEAEGRYLGDQPAEEESKPVGKLPFTDLRFMFFIFILLPVRTLFAHQFLTLPDYVFRCYPESVAARFEWIAGINPLIIVVFVPLVAAFTRKVKVIDMMLIGTLVSALTTFILVPGPDLTRLLIYVALFSLGEALWASRFLEYVGDLAPAGQIGAYMGLANIPWFLAKFTTGLYSGFMLEKFIPKNGPFDSETMWLIYGCIALITPIALACCRNWLIKVEHVKA